MPSTERFPDFFARAPVLRMRDPLALFLGGAADGLLDYHYADAVRLAGHSCPTVAGAYLMVVNGLRRLYGSEVPERGGIEVHLRGARDEGTHGVIAAVATLLTGAAAETGFPGIGGRRRFSRQNLLVFDSTIDGLLGLKRRDTGQGVQVDLDTSRVPADPEMPVLLSKAMTGQATPAEEQRFGALWQGRVQRMLIDHAEDPALVRITTWATA